MKIVNHRLCQDDDKPVPFVKSPNVSSGNLRHEYLIMHYTAGRSAESSVNALTNSRLKASAHLVIGRDGSITQLVEFNTIAWHAGTSSWMGLSGLNRYSIGIELDNAGPLERTSTGWVAWFGEIYPDNQVIEAVHKNERTRRGWHLYTQEQLFVALEVANTLIDHYNIKDILGHDDIAPRRKIDPGPAFPLATFRARLFGRAENGGDNNEDVYYTIANLNIRSNPGEEFARLSVAPLPRGTRLKVVDSEGVWKRVEVIGTVKGVKNVTGWVHGNYIKRA